MGKKYRPHTMENIASQEETVAVLKKTLQSGNLPHLLFYGPPGTGKTSTILALARELYGPEMMRSRILELNASDERATQTRTIPPFKIIILDEADSMTMDAQSALRRTMETYSRIIDPLASRCAKFRFQPVGEGTMRMKLEEICEKENLSITPEAITTVCNISEGDMRRAIMTLQSAQGLTLAKSIPTPLTKSLGRLIDTLNTAFKAKNYFDSAKVSAHIMKQGYSVVQVLQQLHSSILLDIQLTAPQKSRACQVFAEADRALVDGSDEYLQLMRVLLSPF
ncbi:P-loop containing nucleoside triphosphate hydrolase protein [Chytridium lagenaria]|nr:P-loop containing nucleoside triphosphate hydrolase protein [Chytridium lagenaria]